MRSRDPGISEDGFHWMLSEASDYVQELIGAFGREEDLGIRCWLLELIDAAKSKDAFDFLAEQLRGDDWQLRYRAMQGLKHLNIKEGRTLLCDARSWELESPEATEQFRRSLDDVKKQDW